MKLLPLLALFTRILAAPSEQDLSAESLNSSASALSPYIVLLDRTSPKTSEVGFRLHLNPKRISHVYNNTAFRGFTANLTSAQVKKARKVKGARVFGEDKQLRFFTKVAEHSTRKKPPQRHRLRPNTTSLVRSQNCRYVNYTGVDWALQRISLPQAGWEMDYEQDFSFITEKGPMGEGVDIYILSKGLYERNEALANHSRAFSVIEGESGVEEGRGFGTAAASVAGGRRFGVAHSANLIGVKILPSKRLGTATDTLAGLNYVMTEHDVRSKQSGFVASVVMLLLEPEEQSALGPIEEAILTMLTGNVHVVLGSGTSSTDACRLSLSMLGGMNSSAIVAGGTDMMDIFIQGTNTGPCVDLYAPAELVDSAWNEVTGWKMVDGQSNAIALVAGVVALWASRRPDLAKSPGDMKQFLYDVAFKDHDLWGWPDSLPGDRALLLSNGYMASLPPEGQDPHPESRCQEEDFSEALAFPYPDNM